MRSANEQKLIQIVDAGTLAAVRKGGGWVVCRPGCFECCIGVFPISQADALRLRDGLRELARTDPVRAGNVSRRAGEAAGRYAADFPGDAASGIIGEDAACQERFESFANDDPCPALDPENGTCDLYASRPVTCRTFGPALRLDGDSVDVCELCYHGASDEEILASQVEIEIAGLGTAREEEAEAETGLRGQTIVAFALR
jgi:Fe-S-cluster containining protein